MLRGSSIRTWHVITQRAKSTCSRKATTTCWLSTVAAADQKSSVSFGYECSSFSDLDADKVMLERSVYQRCKTVVGRTREDGQSVQLYELLSDLADADDCEIETFSIGHIFQLRKQATNHASNRRSILLIEESLKELKTITHALTPSDARLSFATLSLSQLLSDCGHLPDPHSNNTGNGHKRTNSSSSSFSWKNGGLIAAAASASLLSGEASSPIPQALQRFREEAMDMIRESYVKESRYEFNFTQSASSSVNSSSSSSNSSFNSSSSCSSSSGGRSRDAVSTAGLDSVLVDRDIPSFGLDMSTELLAHCSESEVTQLLSALSSWRQQATYTLNGKQRPLLDTITIATNPFTYETARRIAIWARDNGVKTVATELLRCDVSKPGRLTNGLDWDYAGYLTPMTDAESEQRTETATYTTSGLQKKIEKKEENERENRNNISSAVHRPAFEESSCGGVVVDARSLAVKRLAGDVAAAAEDFQMALDRCMQAERVFLEKLHVSNALVSGVAAKGDRPAAASERSTSTAAAGAGAGALESAPEPEKIEPTAVCIGHVLASAHAQFQYPEEWNFVVRSQISPKLEAACDRMKGMSQEHHDWTLVYKPMSKYLIASFRKYLQARSLLLSKEAEEVMEAAVASSSSPSSSSSSSFPSNLGSDNDSTGNGADVDVFGADVGSLIPSAHTTNTAKTAKIVKAAVVDGGGDRVSGMDIEGGDVVQKLLFLTACDVPCTHHLVSLTQVDVERWERNFEAFLRQQHSQIQEQRATSHAANVAQEMRAETSFSLTSEAFAALRAIYKAYNNTAD